MPALPGTIALTNIPDGASITAADHRNNYTAIQVAVNALIGVLANGVLDGDPMVWDSTLTKWVAASTLASGRPRAPRVVVSTWAGGPPASPVDQDIWVATAVTANNERWHFQYNAGSASANKWEYIGGTPLTVSGDPNAVCNTKTQVAATGYWYDSATMSWTAGRAGEYVIDGEATIDLNGGANGGFGVGVFQPAGIALSQSGGASAAVSSAETRPSGVRLASVAAASVIGIAVLPVTAGTNKLRSACIRVIPGRVA